MSKELKTTFLIHFIVSFLFGTILLVIPKTWANLIQWTPFDPTLTQIYAAALLAIAASSFLAYRATRWQEVKIVVQMEIVFTTLTILISVYRAFIGGAPLFIWGYIIIFIPFAIAWVILYTKNC